MGFSIKHQTSNMYCKTHAIWSTRCDIICKTPALWSMSFDIKHQPSNMYCKTHAIWSTRCDIICKTHAVWATRCDTTCNMKHGVHILRWIGLPWFEVAFDFLVLAWIGVQSIGCTVPYRTLLHRTVPYRAVPYRTVRCRIVPYRSVPYCTVPYRTVPYCTVPYRIAPQRTVPYCTVLYHLDWQSRWFVWIGFQFAWNSLRCFGLAYNAPCKSNGRNRLCYWQNPVRLEFHLKKSRFALILLLEILSFFWAGPHQQLPMMIHAPSMFLQHVNLQNPLRLYCVARF